MTSSPPGADVARTLLLRVVVVLCQALTIGITWPLWQQRSDPPTLPFAPFASLHVDFGIALLASLAFAPWRPRAGAIVHLGVLAGAILLDETRMQPQVISLALLLFATGPGAGARLFGIAQLVSLWGWSGVHKLLSPAFFTEGGVLVTRRFAGCPEFVARALVVAIAVGEVALAVAACVPRTRPWARRIGAAMHLAILVWLSPLALDWNESVWPWNAALAFAAWVFLAPDSEPASLRSSWREDGRRRWRASSVGLRAVVLAELVVPAGFEFGVVPAPFAHALYCLSTPRAYWFHADGTVTRLSEEPALRVFLPGTRHALVAAFESRARSGDQLVLVEQRRLLRALGITESRIRKE